jgi:hypothetical protein
MVVPGGMLYASDVDVATVVGRIADLVHARGE